MNKILTCIVPPSVDVVVRRTHCIQLLLTYRQPGVPGVMDSWPGLLRPDASRAVLVV